MDGNVIINANHWGLIFMIVGLASPFLIYLLKTKKSNKEKHSEANTSQIKELSDAIKLNSKVTFELSASLKEQKLSCELVRKPIERKLTEHDKDIKSMKENIIDHETSILLIKQDIKSKMQGNETINSH